MRAILYDADGGVIDVRQRENQPEYFTDGRVEQDPAAWQNVLCDV